MAQRKSEARAAGGKYLAQPDREERRCRNRRNRRCSRCIMVVVLLTWDGTLLYMILHCLIEPAWGAVFMAVLSVYMGFQMQ